MAALTVKFSTDDATDITEQALNGVVFRAAQCKTILLSVCSQAEMRKLEEKPEEAAEI